MKKILGLLILTTLISSSLPTFAATATPSPTPTTVTETNEKSKTETTADETGEAESDETDKTEDDETDANKDADDTLPSPSPSASPATKKEDVPAIEMSDEFFINIVLNQHKYTIDKDVTIELYDSNDNLLGTQTEKAKKGMYSLKMTFKLPEKYRMGEKFKVKLASGLRSIKYYDTKVEAGGDIEVKTYGYTNDNGEYVQCNGCNLNGNTHFDKELCIYIEKNLLENVNPGARVIDGIAMMPVRAIGEAMGLKVTYDKEYDSVVCSIGDKEVIFNANSAYTTIFGKDTFAPHKTVYIDGSLFVPVRTLVEAFESSLDVLDFDEHLDILIGESPIVKEYRNNSPVNKNGITSSTNYLVWVSKHEYKVRVYEGSQYHWDMLKEFPCALGAWNTPTITGQFEYIERTQWNYSGYYVGPVLRFHNGYALHSTLLYYNGTEYDGRVGVNISHGCVRLHPGDINWIANTIPFRTRIYITE